MFIVFWFVGSIFLVDFFKYFFLVIFLYFNLYLLLL